MLSRILAKSEHDVIPRVDFILLESPRFKRCEATDA